MPAAFSRAWLCARGKEGRRGGVRVRFVDIGIGGLRQQPALHEQPGRQDISELHRDCVAQHNDGMGVGIYGAADGFAQLPVGLRFRIMQAGPGDGEQTADGGGGQVVIRTGIGVVHKLAYLLGQPVFQHGCGRQSGRRRIVGEQHVQFRPMFNHQHGSRFGAVFRF